ncbi:trypsin-like peptidase domain-containing protein [Carboxylicivirga sp. N1Y90]|uniref:trypsin-like peptidase domain-containing protein n=1 Tax=Carboxylicivirga fragile TaxID=3417571 RepID=UPI003D348CF2|nr:hypothetical protein [Marinilabiliaceae bacterium N1Y90]
MLVAILKVKGTGILEFKGNGFIVNKKGLLLSAGHLFKESLDMKDYYAAVPSSTKRSKLYTIRKYYFEHFDPLKAESEDDFKRKKWPKYEDLFIGRVLKLKPESHFKLRIKRPKADERLNSRCFLRRPDIEEFPFENGEVDLSSLQNVTESNPIKSREFSIVSDESNDYQKQPERIELIKRYNNTMWLKYPNGKGSSGSPIFNNDGDVVGIHLRGARPTEGHWKHILCSKYIRRQCRHIR